MPALFWRHCGTLWPCVPRNLRCIRMQPWPCSVQGARSRDPATNSRGKTLVAVHNMTSASNVAPELAGRVDDRMDHCLSGRVLPANQLQALEPYAVQWLVQS